MNITALRIAPLAITLAAPLLAQTPLKYPVAARGTQVDTYHGTSVADPYRWLENPDSPETRAWIQAENAVTFGYLGAIPERAQIRARLEQAQNYVKYGAGFKAGGRYFFYMNTGLQSQNVLYVQDSRNDKPRVLLDPNTLSSTGIVALSTVSVSHNGRYISYSINRAGSDWQEFRVREIDSGKDLPEVIQWAKFSGSSWTHDNKGFFYSRYDAPKDGNPLTSVNKNQKLYYHRVGTPQSRDQLIYDRPDEPDWGFDANVTDDGTFLIINVWNGTDTRNRLYFIDFDNPGKPRISAPVVKLIDRLDALYSFAGNDGTNFYVRTDLQAPNGRVVGIDIDNPRQERWYTLVPEGKEAMVSAKTVGGRLAVSVLQDAHSAIRFYDLPRRPATRGDRLSGMNNRRPAQGDRRRGLGLNSALFEIQLPDIGSADDIAGTDDDNEMFYTFTSFLRPKSIYRFDVGSRKNEVWKEAKTNIDVSKFETRQVFYSSKDGTRVPMFIVARKGLQLNGNNPTLLYGYGGFDISETPGFSSTRLVWLEMGGVYASANLRGGGEYGRAWHEGGMLDKKQNVFDDFIGAAEYLIKEKYTSTPKLAITGGSNGGLLVGAVLNQRPDLFGAAIPAVGVMDMLRFQKFTIGWAWTSDYGSSDDPAQFKTLYAYSPLHNIKPGTCYPATLVLTADHDDRVVPGHSFKYAAALQAAQSCAKPTLIRIDTDAGHGAGKPTSKSLDEYADRYAFLVKNLGMTLTFR
jgi:prolyl oligopeptidase